MSLFFETKFVEANTDALKKNEKSLDTEKSRDEMSHSGALPITFGRVS